MTTVRTYDEERNKKLYNSDVYENNTSNWEDSVSKYRAEALIAAIKNANLNEEITSILDVGCGSGGVISKLATDYNSIFKSVSIFKAIDLSATAIKIANNLYGNLVKEKLKFEVGTVENENGQYDLITLLHVLEHCPDMVYMLDVCSKKSKYIYINVPIEVNLLYALRGNVLANQYIKYGHLNFFNEEFIRVLLKENDYQILSEVYSNDFLVEKSGFFYNIIKPLRSFLGLINKSFATKLLGGYSYGILISKNNK